MRVGHRALAAALAALSLLLCRPSLSATPSCPAVGRTPRLLVLVVVDGLPWDLLWSHRDDLTGGLRVLLEEGHVEAACRYRHLNTETGPGHASLSTGAPPRVHGIVGNWWCESDGDRSLRTVGTVDPLQGGGRADPRVAALGPHRLRVPTLGDRLVESSPDARVVSVGGKDRAAILLAGRDPRHVVYWQALPSGRFETSAYYDSDSAAAREAARIVAPFNDARIGSAVGVWLGRIWGSFSKLVSGVASGRGVRSSALPLTVVFSNELATDLALELIQSRELRLGHGKTPDLLCLAYSETDAVFHLYGTESREAAEALRRLDRALEKLLHGIRGEFPQGGVILGLSADHGFLPTSLEKTGTPEDLGVEIDRQLVRELCIDPSSHPVLCMHGCALWYDRAALPMKTVAGPCGPAGREVGRADLDRALRLRVADALGRYVETVLPTGARASWAGSPQAEFAENLLAPGREADAYVFPRPGVIRRRPIAGWSSHGTHHDYDTHVPLLLWGDGIAAVRSDAPCTPYDFAPTLAARIGIVLPASTGRDLLADFVIPSRGAPRGLGPGGHRQGHVTTESESARRGYSTTDGRRAPRSGACDEGLSGRRRGPRGGGRRRATGRDRRPDRRQRLWQEHAPPHVQPDGGPDLGPRPHPG